MQILFHESNQICTLPKGCAERFVQTLERTILERDSNLLRDQKLSTFLLTYRTAADFTTGVSPCKIFYSLMLREE